MTVDESALEAKRAEAAANPHDMRVRLDLARLLTSAEYFEEATAVHVWFWEHALENQPEMAGVRRSYFARDLENLIARHAPARGAITTLRDQVAPPSDREPELEAFSDWVCLNRVLGCDNDTLRWFDEVYKTLPVSGRLSRVLDVHVRPLLHAEGRLAEGGALLGDPLAMLARAVESRARIDPQVFARFPSDHAAIRELGAKRLRGTAVYLVRALHAAGRTVDVRAVVDEARRLDPSKEMSSALASAQTEGAGDR